MSKRLSKIEATSHAHMKFVHTTGPMTFVERNWICEEEKHRKISRLKHFHYQHYKDDGTFLNEHAEKLYALTELEKIVSEIEEPMTKEERIALENEVYEILMGPDLHGRTRGYGLGKKHVEELATVRAENDELK
ncbi:hypothetical protein GOBAR_DD33031 [Gossypium barbadense]|nr:hypothetical protein GOBAR_DD33031 [Gossypium barbadense]